MMLLGSSNAGGPNIYPTIKGAVEQADGPTDIKITSNLYEEMITITEPNLRLATKEKAGQVTIKQREHRCICIDVGVDNTCTLQNLRLQLTGPNADANICSYQSDMAFET